MKIFIKAVPGALVRDPVSMRQIQEKGSWVDLNTYWTRRLQEGDVLQVDSPDLEHKG